MLWERREVMGGGRMDVLGITGAQWGQTGMLEVL